MAFEHGSGVGQHHGDGIALADATTLQGRSQLTGTLVTFLPGVLTGTLDDGNALGIDEGRPFDERQRRQRNIVGRIPVQPYGVRVNHGFLLTYSCRVCCSRDASYCRFRPFCMLARNRFYCLRRIAEHSCATIGRM
ncbi:hypothetical protein SDC9_189590 [bioreactor metagenome]|uniref:Uncharacterized protein n=1 Tax=bioreactor metagenome TaxID=1076179 RepID=A0A645I0T2_9ZZZZ